VAKIVAVCGISISDELKRRSEVDGKAGREES
jgi:hypothetical protein